MGKKSRKTRWRALAITDDQSDSEESNADFQQQSKQEVHASGHQGGKPYYSSKFAYLKKHQYDNGKSTRSTTENKITFNEDEYTRITTPRQDVLFKKGYLNKPKTYQTQTSTGNSTTSTGNSTGNGTPDHQSADGTEGTDLEYESRFLYPGGGFIDQNGIYYSYEPYQLLFYNMPYCYPPEYDHSKGKRYSTGSLSESMSPHNEEASQDYNQSGGEMSANNSEYNQSCNNAAYENSSADIRPEHTDSRKVKKRRRRKVSTSKDVDDISSDSSVESEVADVEKTSVADSDGKKQVDTMLKPDAQEFIPRAYRQPEAIPIEFVNFPPNVIPMPTPPFIPNYNSAFVPIPVNFIPPPPPEQPEVINYVNFIPNTYVPETDEDTPTAAEVDEKPAPTPNETKIPKQSKNNIDIEKIVSKLEEAAKEQQANEAVNARKPRPRSSHVNVVHKNKCSKLPPKISPVYAEMVKKAPTKCARFEKKHVTNSETTKKLEPKQLPVTPKSKPSQWIAVSSKKRRKHRSGSEEVAPVTSDVADDLEETSNDDFESYDVNTLVDVVVATSAVGEVATSSAPALPTQTVEDLSKGIKMPTVAEVEMEMRQKVIAEKKNPKRKSGKGAARRVIITDNLPEINETETSEKTVDSKPSTVDVPVKEDPAVEKVSADQAQKKKKKKKVSVKSSTPSPNPALSTDDTYDFLIDSTVLESTEDKTNIEMSQELDRMIQKGMYNSLEEKIRSLNVGSLNDNFFNTITTATMLKAPPIKSSNFGSLAILNKTIARNPSEETAVSMEVTKVTLPTLEPQPSTSKTGIFLEDPDVNCLLQPSETLPPVLETTVKNQLYPITQAVKEWMSKTRENTPEIEILKSPSTIYKEFCASDTEDTETEVSAATSEELPSRQADALPETNDEVVLFTLENRSRENSTGQDAATQDLLECWENEIPTASPRNDAVSDRMPEVINGTVCDNDNKGLVDKAEDVLEIYESRYGKNEDFLKLKAEVEEKTRSFPKHGNLPYRAICCSIM